MSKPEKNDKFAIKSDGARGNDLSKRDVIYEVKKDGVTLDMTANYQEAISHQRGSPNSVVYALTTNTGNKVRVS